MNASILAIALTFFAFGANAGEIICDEDSSTSEYVVTFTMGLAGEVTVAATKQGQPVIDSEDYHCEQVESGYVCGNTKAAGPIITYTRTRAYPKAMAKIVYGKKQATTILCNE